MWQEIDSRHNKQAVTAVDDDRWLPAGRTSARGQLDAACGSITSICKFCYNNILRWEVHLWPCNARVRQHLPAGKLCCRCSSSACSCPVLLAPNQSTEVPAKHAISTVLVMELASTQQHSNPIFIIQLAHVARVHLRLELKGLCCCP